VTRTLLRLSTLALIVVTMSGCAAAVAYKKGNAAAKGTDWDAAVAHYRTAVQEDPDRPEYRIAMERAMLEAALMHAIVAKDFEAKGQLDAAVREYRRASEYDPANRQLASKVAELDRRILDQIESDRPRPKIDEMRERARRLSAEPTLNPASRDPLDVQFSAASVRDVLRFIADATGINITFTSDYRDPPAYSVQLTGVTLEQALQQVLSANSLFYKILNNRTVLVIPDTAQNRARYEEQVIRTFFLSHADPTELVQLLNTIMRVPGVPLVPAFVANKTQNSVTIRASAPLVAIAERLIQANDRPRAEILLDVQILEVSRTRAKQFGLDLGNYSITGIFSPEVAPTTSSDDSGTVTNVPPFNLNTISRGISAADFYATVPTAIIRFLETDSQTKLVAKPQLRGQEGQKITLNLGDEFPVPSTTFGSLGGAGSVATQPISSFNYKPVGIIVNVTPRVTFDGDVVMELTVESSTLGQDVNIAGQNLPSFGSRKVETKIRLRDGESTLLAGLLREDERRSLRGFPGLMRLPVFRQLFTSNDLSKGQTDIVILLTPKIVRGHELTQQDVDPVYIGSQQHLGLTGPPPLIAAPAPETAPVAPAGPAAAPQQGGVIGQPAPAPAGTLPQPGIVPPPPEVAPPPRPEPSAPQAEAPAPETPPAPAAEPAAASGDVQLTVTPPGQEFRMGGGPYTVPISVTNAPRLSTLTVTLTYNPAVVKVRNVQEGSFMRQGGIAAQFTQQVDPASGRVDLTVVRGGDVVGASGTGLVAAVLFDPVAPGTTTVTATGSAAGPSGAALRIQVSPTSVTVK
jgi:general secretion pathway protein D